MEILNWIISSLLSCVITIVIIWSMRFVLEKEKQYVAKKIIIPFSILSLIPAVGWIIVIIVGVILIVGIFHFLRDNEVVVGQGE